MTTVNESGTIPTTQFDGSDEEFWDAVAVYNDPEAEETEAIRAAVLLQQVLMLAQDAMSRPDELAEETAEASERPSSSSQTRPAVVPQRVIHKPRPGDIVSIERAVELFAERWVLRPAGPVGDSTLSAVRDYRVHEGQLQYNASYPAVWQDSAGTISDCPQWVVIVQQQIDGVRVSRTTQRPAAG